MDANHEKVREQFGKTAAAYVTSRSHAEGDELRLMTQHADPSGKRVLDVATGGGHTALAFARAGARVTATDLTPEMLGAAEAFVRGELEGAAVTFGVAPAEDLPFGAESFDVVTCRIAAHHFAAPEPFVREAARVLIPGGLLLLVDNLAPEAPMLAAAMNHIERTRDPSHVEAYTVRAWVNLFAGAGLEARHLSRWTTHKPFGAWLARAQTPPDEGAMLEQYIFDLPGAFKRYFEVVEVEGRLGSLAHEAALLVGKKPEA